MPSNTIFGSPFSESQWLNEMNITFPKENAQQVDIPPTRYRVHFPPCVFMVPESLTQEKCEAYAPQKIGFGPYHHLRADLYMMQRKKLDDVMKFLNEQQLQNFQLMVEVFTQGEPVIRSSYDHYLDLNHTTLSWILTIDALFLLRFVKVFSREATQASNDEELAGDILMLENQIPVPAIMQVLTYLKYYARDDNDNEGVAIRGTVIYYFDNNYINGIAASREYEYYSRELIVFYELVSPLKLELHVEHDDLTEKMRQGHLLSVMYHLTVGDIKAADLQFPAPTFRLIMPPDEMLEFTSRGAEMLATAGVPGAAIVQQQLSLMARVPWDAILSLFKSGVGDKERQLAEEIDIPSVSQLTNILGVKFAVTDGGIKGVKFEEEEEEKFYLPLITLKSNSEVILRNLIAYEAALGSTLQLAEYVDLMCGIIDAPKDVEILRNEGVIESSLTDVEITRIFNGINKTTGDKEQKTTGIEKAIEKVNEQYGKIPGVKLRRFFKKYMPTLGKFVPLVLAILVLSLFVFQAFCQIYGCSNHWFKK